MKAIYILFIIAITIISGCAQQQETIKIGAILPLSGQLSFLGESELRGIKLAVDEINDVGGINGKKVELFVEDSKFDPTTAATAANKLINVNNVDILAVSFSPPAQAVLPIAEEKKKLIVFSSLTRGIAKKSKYAFKDYTDISMDVNAISDVLEKNKIERLALLYELTEVGAEFSQAFHTSFSGNITAEEKFEIGSTDVRTQLLKIKTSGAEALAFTGLPNDNIQLMKQMSELNITIPLFLSLAAFPEVTREKDLLEKFNPVSTWYNYYRESDINPITKNFIEKFKSKFGREPDADAAFFYDDMNVVAETLKKCNTANSDCLVQELLKIKNYTGVSGMLGFDEDGNSIRSAYLIQFINDSWQPFGGNL